MSEIICKTVKRFYFDGKGYANEKSAYKAKARRQMIDMVLGDWWPDTEDQAEARKQRDERFAVLFPHTQTESCDKECRWLDDESDYAFKSCKAAQKEWIEQRAVNLMSQAIEDINRGFH